MPKKKKADEPIEERRSDDQNAALETAFADGTLLENKVFEDRRTNGVSVEKTPPTVVPVETLEEEQGPTKGSPAVDHEAFGVEAHPDTRASLDVPVVGRRDVPPGEPIPPMVVVSSDSVESRGPLVPLVPLSEVHPSTVETAVGFQRIPNDQINAVFEDANGVKRDALGHPFT
jgi:hypothetical protein